MSNTLRNEESTVGEDSDSDDVFHGWGGKVAKNTEDKKKLHKKNSKLKLSSSKHLQVLPDVKLLNEPLPTNLKVCILHVLLSIQLKIWFFV